MNHQLANAIKQALIDADILLWSIAAEENHEDLLTKADKVIQDLQQITLTAQTQETDEIDAIDETEENQYKLFKEEEPEEEEHHDYNIFDNPFEYLEKDLRPPF